MKIFGFLLFGLSVAATSEIDLQEFVNGNNLFTADIYKEIAKNEKANFIVSPFSVETALAFVQSGCEGETAEQIQNTLHLPNSKDKIENGVKILLSTMKANENYTFYTVNKIYLEENFQIKGTFVKAAIQVYNADFEDIDFTKNNEAAEQINDWVEKHTKNKIHNLIDPNNLDEYTKAVLINSLYFEAKWSQPFILHLTRKQKFYKRSSDITVVDMMFNYLKIYNYYESSQLDAKLLELPFTDGDTSMTIILPNEKDGIKSLESKIDMVFAPHSFTQEVVNVAIPKFKMETKIDLKKTMGNLGVNKAFDEVEADLSGIAGKKGDLYINDFLQKTFFDLNEAGVEPSAATYHDNVTFYTSPHHSLLKYKEFIVNHPFIFYVKMKNVIIFAGKIVVPLH